MNTMIRVLLGIVLVIPCCASRSFAKTDLALVELNKPPFILGREYFNQRSRPAWPTIDGLLGLPHEFAGVLAVIHCSERR